MTRNRNSPGWYVEANVAASVRKARESDVMKSSIIGGLEDTAFPELPNERIKAIIESIPEQTADPDTLTRPLSQVPSTDAEPRDRKTRIVSLVDVAYLSPREAARVLGLALEQFEGNTVRPPATESTECDLYWHQQHATVGIRIVPVMAGKVSRQHVSDLSLGSTTVTDIRSPSELAVVTNGRFADEAKSEATENDIGWFDGGHLKSWLRRAKITQEAVGTVLEDGENHDGPLNDLVELPDIPSSVSQDPFKMKRAIEEAAIPVRAETAQNPASTEESTTSSSEQPPSDSAEPSPSRTVDSTTTKSTATSGETGRLYADPKEDGDYHALDRLVDEIKPGPSDTNSNTEKASPAPLSEQRTPEEHTVKDVPRKDLIFELLDTKRDVLDSNNPDGKSVGEDDIRAIFSNSAYSLSQYESEFESLTAALNAVNIEFSGDLE